MNKKIVLFLIGILALATFVSAASVTLYPNGPGYYNQWTWSNTTGCEFGETHWGCVDETTQDGDSTYLRANSGVPKDTFAMTDMTATPSSIKRVAVYYTAKAIKLGGYLYPILRDGNLTTEYIDTSGWDVSNNSSWTVFSKVYSTNPMTNSSWTKDEVNALQVGMQCIPDFSYYQGCLVTQVRTQVIYS
ncbi:MAG TPA: hypothetical protein VJC39_05410 [Candidatus Nanoarchaeia archaeon]|nr:hypothetical protein [Candidatus Nanoarchaeia archaeon]